MNWNNPRQGFKRAGWLVVTTILVSVGLGYMLYLPVSPALADLPPRPTTLPATPEPNAATKPGGGWIQVRVSNATTQSVIVQWQDTLGAWNDVSGWRGQFDTIENSVGIKTWWVDQSLFGAPNFRWMVLDANGKALVPSPVFALPTEKNQSVLVQVSLTP